MKRTEKEVDKLRVYVKEILLCLLSPFFLRSLFNFITTLSKKKYIKK